MSSKHVFGYHPESGIYTGKVVAFESPLEPGVWHIPACATELEPPEAADDELVFFEAGEWVKKKFEPAPSEEPPAPADAPEAPAA